MTAPYIEDSTLLECSSSDQAPSKVIHSNPQKLITQISLYDLKTIAVDVPNFLKGYQSIRQRKRLDVTIDLRSTVISSAWAGINAEHR